MKSIKLEDQMCCDLLFPTVTSALNRRFLSHNMNELKNKLQLALRQYK